MNLFCRKAFGMLAGAGVLLGALAAGEAAQDSGAEWKVAFASVKITPEQPVSLAGYASRTGPFEKVESDLYAKALCLEDRNGQVGVLVTTDLIGLRADLCENVCSRVAKSTGLKREQILLNASHIHTGPSLSMGRAGASPDQTAKASPNAEYTLKLQDKLVDLIVTAVKNKREPSRLSWGQGVANFVLSRREWTDKGVVLGKNARAPADRSVPVLRIDAPDGTLRCVLFGAATHNTTLRPQHKFICGDYAGYAQANLEKAHPGVQAMFMLGCAGDSDPYPHGTLELARQHGAELSGEVDRVMTTKLTEVHGPLTTVLGTVDLPVRPRTAAEQVATKKKAGGGQRPPEQAKQAGHITAPLAVWQFGKDLTLVALSGEVVVDYVAFLEKALGPMRLWVAAYSNDWFGYLPSARLVAEGGYETRGARGGVFTPQSEEALVAKVRELAAKAGRTLPQ